VLRSTFDYRSNIIKAASFLNLEDPVFKVIQKPYILPTAGRAVAPCRRLSADEAFILVLTPDK
jgi:hypothetical protein